MSVKSYEILSIDSYQNINKIPEIFQIFDFMQREVLKSLFKSV